MPDDDRTLPRIPRDPLDDFTPDAVRVRHELAEEAAGWPLPHLRGQPVPPGEARGNIENLVGFAQVPVGLAGPLRVDTGAGTREVYVPMATTEGAMVAAYSRGMRLLSVGEAPRSRVVHEGLTQNPVLVYDRAQDAIAAAAVADEALPELQAITAGITNHGRLVSLDSTVVGRRLIVRLVFTTGDAIGINMAARATDLCVAELAQRTGATERYVHGQDVEKRANARALVEGRGRSVVCDVTLPRALVEARLRVTPKQLAAINRSYATGYAHLGTANWLVQVANGLTAVLIACGQDAAYVTEMATGFLDLEVTPSGDLFAAATLPSMLVGTVGGGSGQGTAAECLDILGCRGAGHGNTFAEILGAVVLAGDLSLMAAFCTHEFTDAHERLGRNRPG